MNLSMDIDHATGRDENRQHIKRIAYRNAGFSLVEITLALGLAALCLIGLLALLAAGLQTQQASIRQSTANDIITEILGDLRADIRLPPGQASHEGLYGFGLHGHWAQMYAPDTIFFTNDVQWTGNVYQGNPPPDPGAAFRAKITYLFPPNASTSVARIAVSWPAQGIPGGTPAPAGQVETFMAINR